MNFIFRLKIFTIIISIFITYFLCVQKFDEISLLSLFILYPLIVSCLLCFDDVVKFFKQFKNFVISFNNYARKKDSSVFNTPIGKALNEYFNFLERKVFLLKKDSDTLNSDSFNNPINFLKKSDIDPEQSKEEFFKGILNILSSFYQKNAIVLFYYNKESKECFSISSLSSNKHVSLFLKQMFLNHIINNVAIKQGVVTYYNVENVLEDLSLFGYKQAIVKKVENTDSSNTNEEIYIWFGASSEDVSFSKEEKLIVNLSYEIRNEFETFKKLKVAKNEIEMKTKEAIKKSEYLEFVSHDLRSPLSNLVTILKLLEINQDENNKKEFIEIALNNCDSISFLLEDLLDFSKYKNSDLKASKETFNVINEVNTIVKNFNLRATQKNLKLTLKSDSSNTLINVDKRQFRKIINNLISNAIKYTNEGEINVVCKASKDKLSIKIIDTGIGIKEEDLKDIFNSFKRGDNATNLEGYGLGLFMVKVFASLNSIDVNVKSKENEGSTFELKMQTVKEEEAIVNKKDLAYKKIMLIDDDVDLLSSTKRLLEIKGYVVKEFSNTKDAKEFLLLNKPDLIISDYHIGKDRVDVVLNFIKEQNIKTDIYIVSGKANIDIKDYEVFGVKKILQKPLNLDIL